LRPILEYVGERLNVTNAAHSDVTFEFQRADAAEARLCHMNIGNVELEQVGARWSGDA
jgi:hypothetical protein